MPAQSTFALRILVVDDEPRIRTTVSQCLEDDGHRVVSVGEAAELRHAISRNVFDLVFLDLRLREVSALDLIPGLLNDHPGLRIVVITAYATVETAVMAMKLGAIDYLPKPFTPAQVRHVARKEAERRLLESRVDELEQRLDRAVPEFELESSNPRMRDVIALAKRLATSEATVLLQGESGTGKGVFAEMIHTWSQRAKAPFRIVHCPSLSFELFESELFGHAKGAFTGAVLANPGRLSLAEGGTLFLDEIGELPPALQPKLLRFIQDRKFERVGDPVTRQADVRVLAATNQDLEAAVRERRFREDLFYRLNVVEIKVPPLRERPEDIVPLASRFLSFFASRTNRHLSGLTREAEDVLRQHTWPGNVRELQNAIERAVILSNGPQISEADLAMTRGLLPTGPQIGDTIKLQSLEEEHIRRVISKCRTLEEAARVLGINQTTLRRRRRDYGI